MKAAASGAGGRPVRKPWIPPRFECVEADMLTVGHGHDHFDHDDASNPAGGRGTDPDVPVGASFDQNNPYNS